jgi:GNAT superfamily N-acetyltransferase
MSPQSKPDVSIRPAVFPTDREVVSNLFLAYAQSLPVKLDFQGFEEEVAGLPGKYDVSKEGSVLLAYTANGESSPLRSSETVIGVVALRAFSTSNSIPTCELKRLYLTPSCRGLGVSKRLMDGVLVRARELGYKEMLLDTLSSMTVARRLYGKTWIR